MIFNDFSAAAAAPAEKPKSGLVTALAGGGIGALAAGPLGGVVGGVVGFLLGKIKPGAGPAQQQAQAKQGAVQPAANAAQPAATPSTSKSNLATDALKVGTAALGAGKGISALAPLVGSAVVPLAIAGAVVVAGFVITDLITKAKRSTDEELRNIWRGLNPHDKVILKDALTNFTTYIWVGTPVIGIFGGGVWKKIPKTDLMTKDNHYPPDVLAATEADWDSTPPPCNRGYTLPDILSSSIRVVRDPDAPWGAGQQGTGACIKQADGTGAPVTAATPIATLDPSEVRRLARLVIQNGPQIIGTDWPKIIPQLHDELLRRGATAQEVADWEAQAKVFGAFADYDDADYALTQAIRRGRKIRRWT